MNRCLRLIYRKFNGTNRGMHLPLSRTKHRDESKHPSNLHAINEHGHDVIGYTVDILG